MNLYITLNKRTYAIIHFHIRCIRTFVLITAAAVITYDMNCCRVHRKQRNIISQEYKYLNNFYFFFSETMYKYQTAGRRKKRKRDSECVQESQSKLRKNKSCLHTNATNMAPEAQNKTETFVNHFSCICLNVSCIAT